MTDCPKAVLMLEGGQQVPLTLQVLETCVPHTTNRRKWLWIVLPVLASVATLVPVLISPSFAAAVSMMSVALFNSVVIGSVLAGHLRQKEDIKVRYLGIMERPFGDHASKLLYLVEPKKDEGGQE